MDIDKLTHHLSKLEIIIADIFYFVNTFMEVFI